MARSLKRLSRITHPIVALCLIGCVLLVRILPTVAALPAPQRHPLPSTLVQWTNRSGDYFDRVTKTPPEYLVWSRFPIKIYVQPPDPNHQGWNRAIDQAIQEWMVYLPLQKVEQKDSADIVVDRSTIPIRFPLVDRVRFADTRFELYDRASILLHRVTIRIQPNQPDLSLLAASRHELGHALGIWGHSTEQTDVMYFSQVRTPPPISPRDVNTLKRVYEQPTRLGWKISN